MKRRSSTVQFARAAVAAVCVLGFSTLAFAGPAGKYTSASKCTLTIEPLDMEAGVTDGFFKVTSIGDGTCPWRAVGVVNKSHMAVGGVLSLAAVLTFADLNWVFGPGGDQIEITYFDTEGKQINKQTFNRAK